MGHEIKTLQEKYKELTERLGAQGEKSGADGCKGDELRSEKDRRDDDDPEAPPGSEHPSHSGATALVAVSSGVQGESSSGNDRDGEIR